MHIAALHRRAAFGIAAMLTALLLAFGLLTVPPAQADANDTEVSDASLVWGLNGYAQKGIFGPWTFKNLTGDVSSLTGSVSGGSQTEYAPTPDNSSMPASAPQKTPNAVKFTEGTGTVDPATGEASLSWTGSYTVNAYPANFNAPDEIYSNPQLNVDAAGNGTLSMEFTVGAGSDMSGNPTPEQSMGRLTLATLSGVSVSATGFTVTPDYQGVTLDPATIAGTQNVSCAGTWGAWPAEFVSAVPDSLQPHFYSTGCGGTQDLKPALPLQVVYTTPPAPIPAPALAVSKTSGLNPGGETITVTGTNIKTGFVNQHGAPTAAGVYVQIGYIGSTWQPSQGAASDARADAYSKWVKEAAPSDAYIAWTDNGNGTADFSWTVTVDYDTIVAEQREGSTMAVFTTGAGGTVQAANELAVPISFAVPTVSVSKTTNLDSTGETITVTGTGFLPSPPATSGSRPPLAGKFSGVYVGFGKFSDVWQPSNGAESSARNFGDTKWLVHETELALIGGPGRGGVVAADGTFSIQLEAKKGFTGEPETGNYGIYSYAGGGAVYDLFETYTPITFTPLATDLTFTASPSGQAVEGAPVTLKAKLASPTAGSVTFSVGSKTLGAAAVDADGVATLVVKSLAVGTHAVKAQFTPADPGSFVGSAASLSYTVVVKPVTAAGSFTWGVKQSFRDYVTGPIAAGSISTTNVRSTGSAFVFGQTSGGTFNGSTGTSNYTGSLRFLGHGGILDLTLANPVVRVDSATSGTLLMRVNGSTVPFATLALGSGSKSTSGGAVSYSRVPASLTSQGASAFVNGESQFYPAGTALDPVSFVIGAPSVVGSGTRTVSEFVSPANAVPPTPPATTGITLEGSDPDQLNEGDEVTITADGFESNEQGIKVVIYSEPIILATDVAADAQGVATWTGFLPAGLTGSHTLTLQGSVDRGINLTIAAAAVTTAVGCVAEDAALTWGFKEAFRSYISGAIANGEWTVAEGASYETPNFGWSGGEGNYDADTAEGLIAFTGSVQFTGHGGVLSTTIANPQLRFDGEGKATLLLDITGTTQSGEEVNTTAVEFATIDLAAAEKTESDAQLGYAGAPAVLTPAGAAAFGTYPAGEALDPITVTFSGECATLQAEAPPVDNAAVEADGEAGPGWLLWVILAILLVAAVITTAVLIARRRANA